MTVAFVVVLKYVFSLKIMYKNIYYQYKIIIITQGWEFAHLISERNARFFVQK